MEIKLKVMHFVISLAAGKKEIRLMDGGVIHVE